MRQSPALLRVLLLALFLILPASDVLAQTIILVRFRPASGPVGALRFDDLQPALLHAATIASPASPVQVWVAEDTYYPGPPGTPRSTSFRLRNSVAIYGGFQGDESSLALRQPDIRFTILKGDPLNNDTSTYGNMEENFFHVIFAGPETDNTAVLDGFRVTNGAATGSGPDGRGGGIYIQGGSPRIRNCRVVASQAVFGGGICIDHPGQPIIDATPLTLAEIITRRLPAGQVSSCRALTGQGGAGGGVYNESRMPVIIRDIAVSQNGVVGGPAHAGGGIANVGDLRLFRCFINSNVGRFVPDPARHGGGIDSRGPDARLTAVNCFFGSNSGSGAAMLASVGGQTTLVGCLAVNNFSNNGGTGGIWVEGGSLNMVNCTVFRNVNLGLILAGGVNITNAQVTVTNTILWQNLQQANFSTNPASGISPFDAQIVVHDGDAPTLNYCTIENFSAIYAGVGSNGDNPMFILPAGPDGNFGSYDDDLRLPAGSTLINSGDRSALPSDFFDADADGDTAEPLPMDFYGGIRVVDDPSAGATGPGAAPHVDRGCHESQANCDSCPGPRVWRNPAGGAYDFPGNWDPSSVPGPEQDAIFNLLSAYTVAFPASPTFARSVTVNRGVVSLALAGSPFTISAGSGSPFLTVGDRANDNAVLNITGGPVSSAFGVTMQVGKDARSTGQLNISGPSTSMLVRGDLSIGRNGAGTLTIANGASVTAFTAGIADSPGSSGLLRVSAGSTLNIPFFMSIGNTDVATSSAVLDLQTGGRVNVGPGGILLLPNGLITGSGVIQGPVTSIGRISPGSSPGTITIQGNYQQVGQLPEIGPLSGTLNLELGGSTPGQHDRIDISGSAELAGGLFVSLLPGLTIPPDPDDFRVRIFQALGQPTLSSRFDVALLPEVPGRPDLFFALVYNPPRPGNPMLTDPAVELFLVPFLNGLIIDPAAPPTSEPSGEPTAVATGDLNGDGLDDLVIATSTHLLYIYINQGPSAPAIYGPSIIRNLPNTPATIVTTAIAIEQIDELGGLDLAFTHDPGSGVPGFVTFLSNDGQGTANSFNPPPGNPLLFVGRAPSSLIVANLKNRTAPDFDPRPELAVTNFADDNAVVYRLVNPAAFAFTQVGSPIPTGSGPRGLHATLADSDNGKRSDLLIANQNSNSVTIVPGGGTGSVYTSDAPFSIPVGSRPVDVLPVRFGGGLNRASFVTVNRGDPANPAANPGSVSVVVKAGAASAAASYQPSVDLPAGITPRSLAAADLDDDTDIDLAFITNVGTPQNETIRLRVLRNDIINSGNPGGGGQLALVADIDQEINEAARFVRSARLLTSERDNLVVVSRGGQEGGGPGFDNSAIRPFTRASAPPSCPADFNGDGSLDPDDLSDFITCFFSIPPCPATDFSRDGNIDPDDLSDYITAFFAGC